MYRIKSITHYENYDYYLPGFASKVSVYGRTKLGNEEKRWNLIRSYFLKKPLTPNERKRNINSDPLFSDDMK